MTVLGVWLVRRDLQQGDAGEAPWWLLSPSSTLGLLPAAELSKVHGDIMTCHHDIIIQLCKPPSSDVHTDGDTLAHWGLLVADASCPGRRTGAGELSARVCSTPRSFLLISSKYGERNDVFSPAPCWHKPPC